MSCYFFDAKQTRITTTWREELQLLLFAKMTCTYSSEAVASVSTSSLAYLTMFSSRSFICSLMKKSTLATLCLTLPKWGLAQAVRNKLTKSSATLVFTCTAQTCHVYPLSLQGVGLLNTWWNHSTRSSLLSGKLSSPARKPLKRRPTLMLHMSHVQNSLHPLSFTLSFCVSLSLYIYTHIHIHIHVCIHVYIYTHILKLSIYV